MFIHCPPKIIPDIESVTAKSGRYYITPSGQKLPSVTTVLGARPKPELEAWKKRVGETEANKISRTYSSKGNSLHPACEAYLKNLPLPEMMPDSKALFLSIKPYLNQIDNIWYQETGFWNYQMRMAGRCDLIVHYNGELAVVDFKNSRKIKK